MIKDCKDFIYIDFTDDDYVRSCSEPCLLKKEYIVKIGCSIDITPLETGYTLDIITSSKRANIYAFFREKSPILKYLDLFYEILSK